MSEVFDRKIRSLIAVSKIKIDNFDEIRRALVVGCGTGHEAGILARNLKIDVVGIDIEQQFSFDHNNAFPANLVRMDARQLEFGDASFDLIYSFHAIEHIPELPRALNEMVRVLRPGGGYILGTPNKSRLIGYVGSDVSISKKIKWNIADLKMRLSGNWDNEKGAHAGFTRRELLRIGHNYFGSSVDLTDDYYSLLYKKYINYLNYLNKMHIVDYIFPCVYACGTKSPK